MASLLLTTCKFIIFAQIKTTKSSGDQFMPDNNVNDLVLVNGTLGDVGICVGQNREFTLVGLFDPIHDLVTLELSFRYKVVPTKNVRALSMKRSKRKTKLKRSTLEKVYESYLNFIYDEFKQPPNGALITLPARGQLLFATISLL